MVWSPPEGQTPIRPGSIQGGNVIAAQLLRGVKPADLPVQQSTNVEVIVNLQAAKMLGLEVPMSILMRVNDVIE